VHDFGLELLDELLCTGFGDGWLGVAPSESLLPLLGLLMLVLYVPGVLRKDGARRAEHLSEAGICARSPIGMLGEAAEKHGAVVWVEAVPK
jgi:hypothetical protein